MNNDERFMAEAIRLAKLAGEHGNEPFGAVLVKDGEIVATHENGILTRRDRTDHAELGLIREYSAQTGVTDYSDYTLYASCEPCFMCAGALVQVKMGTLVFAASNYDLMSLIGRPGCEVTRIVFENSFTAPTVRQGILREESIAIMQAHFAIHPKS